MLAKQEPMIRIDDKHRVLPQIVMIHIVQHFTHVGIHHRQQGHIVFLDDAFPLWAFRHEIVRWPPVEL